MEKQTLVDKFINKVDLPLGMSKAELEIFQKEVEKLKHDLAVRDKALELALISRKEMLEKQNCFTCSVEKAKIEFLEQAEKELKGK